MGGMELDLRGQWVADADIDIDLRMGGGSVTLPDGVQVFRSRLAGATSYTVTKP